MRAPLEELYIYFDTATFDEIEKDEKVALVASTLDFVGDIKTKLSFEGDNGGPIGSNRRHNGPSHWLLHPQRG